MSEPMKAVPLLSHQDWVLVLSAMVVVLNTHSGILAALCSIFVLAALVWPAFRRHPAAWFGLAAAWLPTLVLNWVFWEDHAYFGMYWCVALGVALRSPDFFGALRFQVRVLLAGAFGFAVFWKLLAPEFLDGRLFEWIILQDYRFNVLFGQWLGGLSAEDALANQGRWTTFRVGAELATELPMTSTPRLIWIARAMALWTVVIESAIAVSFAAPDDSRLARLRHPALLLFSFALYPIAPIVGFGCMFMTMGFAISEHEPAWLRNSYAAGWLLFSVMLLVGSLF